MLMTHALLVEKAVKGNAAQRPLLHRVFRLNQKVSRGTRHTKNCE
jgi:hypothetical protein